MEFNQNQLLTERMEGESFDLIANIEDLAISSKTLTDETQSFKAEIPEVQVQL